MNPDPSNPLGGSLGLRSLTGCLFAILLWLMMVAAAAVALVWAWRFIVHG